MVTFFMSSLGKIALAVACFTSLCGAHDWITGLYLDWSSLVRVVVFKLTHDCAGCFTVVLGHLVVPCLLQCIWGWSVTFLVIFDLIMTSMRIGLLWKQEGFLLHDSTSSPESNLGSAWDRKSDGTKKPCGNTHSYFNPTFNLCPWRDTSCHLTKIDKNALGMPWGNLKNENFKGDQGQYSVT